MKNAKEIMRENVFHIFLAVLVAIGLCGVAEARPLRDPTNGSANGNRHDFSSSSTSTGPHATTETRVCIFCHTPHGASPQSTLWNRPDPRGANAFNLYSSGTLVIDNTGPPDVQALSLYNNADTSLYPNGSSRLCMSCHDGVVGIGEVLNGNIPVGDTIITATVTNTNGPNIVNLSTSHPISFVYNAAVITQINNVKSGYTTPLLADVPLDGNSRMQCTTCHDPHNDTKLDGASEPFWRHLTGATYADVCDTCHHGNELGGVGTSH